MNSRFLGFWPGLLESRARRDAPPAHLELRRPRRSQLARSTAQSISLARPTERTQQYLARLQLVRVWKMEQPMRRVTPVPWIPPAPAPIAEHSRAISLQKNQSPTPRSRQEVALARSESASRSRTGG